ncbi:MAG: magnesium transporter [Lachnospiraceae bacterium]|nr:magnesium transporter [Lachnospiraceae bacterium]
MDEKNTLLEEEKERIPERPDYEQELVEIIRSSASDEEIREELEGYHDNDIAGVLEELTPEERERLYRILGVEAVSEVFAYLEEDVEKFINEVDEEQAADILESMDADDAVAVLDELEEDKSTAIKELMDEEALEDIDLIESYEDDEIGSRMTTNFIVIKKDFTVRQAMKALIEQAAENDNILTIYVVNDDETFYGAIDLKELIIARDYVELETLIVTSYPYVYAKESISECIEELKDYSEDSIPVLDNDNHILGVITSWDIVEAVDDEMSEDYAMLAGLTEEEEMQEPLKDSVRKRLPWLIVLLFLGLGVSTVIGLFEPVVAQLTIVVSFQSTILGMAGNVGTQSLAVTIRVLMDEGLTWKQELKLVWKEIKVGFTNGLILGLMSFVLIGLFIYFFKGKSFMFSYAISGCIGASLLLAMVISSFMGTMIPITLKKMKIDPAVASGPLISTINDLVAVVSYYGLTWLLLIQVLQLVE